MHFVVCQLSEEKIGFFKKKVGHSQPLFIYFSLFNTVDSKQMFNINFADDLWYWKRPLYQLSHNHC